MNEHDAISGHPTAVFHNLVQPVIGESRLLWRGFPIWGSVLFYTRSCCTLCL